jgi:hypothetical protein
VRQPRVAGGRVEIVVDVEAPGVRGASCRYALETRSRALVLDWELDKIHVTDAESVYVVFPLALGTPAFRLDLSGVPCTPGLDQLPGTTRHWYSVRRWADASDGDVGVTLAPLDAPLVQLGGIVTGTVAFEPDAPDPVLVSWALNNHWRSNFRASQGGPIPLRYRLTSHAGPCVDAAAARFGAEAAAPALVLRTYARFGPERGAFAHVDEAAGIELTAKPAQDRDGVIVRLLDLAGTSRHVALELGTRPASACTTSVLEVDGAPLEVSGHVVRAPVAARGLTSLRVRF